MRITKRWGRDGKCANALGEKVPIDLLNLQLPQAFNLEKKKAISMSNNKVKHNK